MKTDLRIIKSKAAIENSFINLVAIKGFENVSLIEIAEKAMCNRNTIYLHYGSKEGILESIAKSSFAKHFGEFNLDFLKQVGLNRKKIENLYQRFFVVINENIELYRIILTDTAMAGYLEKETNKIKKLVFSLFNSSNKKQIGISFLINGILGIASNYIIYDQGTVEDNIKILTDLTISNLRRLAYIK